MNAIQSNFTTHSFFQSRRLLQVLLSTFVGLSIVIFVYFIKGSYSTPIVLTIVNLFILFLCFLVKKNNARLAAHLFIWTLTLALTYLLSKNSGIRGTGLLAYPTILIFAALIGGRRSLIAVLSFICISTALLVYVNAQGIYVNTIRPVDLFDIADLWVSLILCTFCILIFVIDINHLLQQLKTENSRVLASQEKLEYLSHHDPLTNLPNRVLTKDRFEQAVIHLRHHPVKLALFYLDLDHFKTINDSIGHHHGDLILQEVAKRLTTLLSDEDTISRHSGDEFIILLESAHSMDEISEVAQKILSLVSSPFMIYDEEYICTASLGIAVAPDEGLEFETLLKKADIAMYKAKDTGRNNFHFFDEQLNVNITAHLETLSNLRKAIREKQFILQYQPQFDLNSGFVIGAEALVRWQHPTKGMIPPLLFIPLAESSGLIVDLGAWVIEEACRQAKEWLDQDLINFPISVNVSSVQCKRGNLDGIVIQILSEFNLPPQLLELELTESLLIDDDQNLRSMLLHLRELGVRFAIDDFGTGYSNLGYLKKFDMETLKVDQSFIRKLGTNTHDEAIVKAILQIAQSLGLHTVAEGVEDQAVAELLKKMGCQYAQGYHWSKPIFADEMTTFLIAEKEKRLQQC